MMGNPFDEGITLTDGPAGGYTLPLSGFRQYYTINVLGTGAISEAQFKKEFPKAYDALIASDKQLADYRAFLNDPAASQALFEIVNHLRAGKQIELKEAFPPPSQNYKPPVVPPKPPMQGQPPEQAQMPPEMQKPNADEGQDAPPAQPAQSQPPMAAGGMDNHTHNMNCDAQGNGSTDACAADGHTHPVQGGKIMPVNNHTHEVAPQQGQPAPANAPPAQPPPPVNNRPPMQGGF
jgi:hypothetical protein